MIKQVKSLPKGRSVKARIRLPGSKSITHRALMMGALGTEACVISNPLKAEDTEITAAALTELGVGIEWREQELEISAAPNRWRSPPRPIWLGNSGTTTRLLTGLLAAGKGVFRLDGTPRLRERPIGPVLDVLEAQGAEIRYGGRPGCPPVEMVGNGLKGGAVEIDAGQSSQFLSALLMAAPCARADMTIGWERPVASFPYVEITLSMMKKFGIETHWVAENKIHVAAGQEYRVGSYEVEGDCSTASYFWAAAAATAGECFTSPLRPSALQGDCRLLDVLAEMGCKVFWEDGGVRVVGPPQLDPIDLDMNTMPDMVPTIAALAAFAGGTTRIRNVAHLRIKESDRLSAMTTELRKLAVDVEELPDGLVISKSRPGGARVEAHDDHRIAMALSVVGLRTEGVVIEGAETVAKSFPEYWDEFEKMIESATEK